ncbi:MAG: polysaccharide deacetylase family protein [Cyclobacteriaceae bacterium]
MKLKSLGFFLLITLLFSCQEKKHQAGICLSFDDRSIKEWFALRDLFNEYGVKATFFVTQFDSLSAEEIEMLHTLEKDGHEIASHGALHIDAEKTIKKYSYKEYFKTEIDPSITSMKKSGFEPVSFAYAYGTKYRFTDYLLLKKFKCTRGVADMRKEKDLSKHNEIFYSYDHNRKFISALIDRAGNVNDEMISRAINRASERNEVLMIFGHVPSETAVNEYSFDVNFLKSILEKAKSKQLKFYRFKDLVK